MPIFPELDAHLAQDFSTNYWADDAVNYARELVRRFDPKDWSKVRETWTARHADWQYRCAEALSWGEPSEAGPVLTDMLQSDDAELVITAAESLRSVRRSGGAVTIPAPAEARIRAIAASKGGPVSLNLHALLSHQNG